MGAAAATAVALSRPAKDPGSGSSSLPRFVKALGEGVPH